MFCSDGYDCLLRELGWSAISMLVMLGASLAWSWGKTRYRDWRITRGRAACARGEHAWVPRPPQDLLEMSLPYSRPVRCSRCNVRARLIGTWF